MADAKEISCRYKTPNLGDGGVGYRDALFVDGLYGSACKEIVPFNRSNSGSLWIKTAEVSWAMAATKASASETDLKQTELLLSRRQRGKGSRRDRLSSWAMI